VVVVSEGTPAAQENWVSVQYQHELLFLLGKHDVKT